jgi:hypothetical protein
MPTLNAAWAAGGMKIAPQVPDGHTREFVVILAGGVAAVLPADPQTGAEPAGTVWCSITINGHKLEQGDKLHPMQAAFIEHDGFPVWILHTGTDLLGGGSALGSPGWCSERRNGRHPQREADRVDR